MTVTVGEIVRGVLSFTAPAASVMQNVFTWELQTDDVDDQNMLDDIVTWFEDVWLDKWDGLADTAANAFLVEVDILNGDGTVNRNIGDAVINVSGSNAGELLPAASSGYFQADTERTGSVGKKFIPGINDSQLLEGLFTPAAVAIFVQLLSEYMTGIPVDVVGLLMPGILSRVTSSFQEFTGSGYTVNIPAYQRRRKPQVGS